MPWKIIITETFSKTFKKYNKKEEFLNAIDKKLQRIKENPHDTGGNLSGKLHSYKSTRIMKRLRLIFRINEKEHSVFIIGIDHRKFDYENF